MKTIVIENNYEEIREARVMKVVKSWEKGELEDLQTIRELELFLKMLHEITCAIILSHDGESSHLISKYIEIHQMLYKSYKEKKLSYIELFLLWKKAGGELAS